MNDFWIRNDTPAVVLAPMEGVTDRPMRELMGEIGGFTHMVTEFLRVSQTALPSRVVLRHMPEARLGSRTTFGVPVALQLLGGHPGRLAETAVEAVKSGARAIDLNFGCPAPTVNRHDGGASLLRHPERIRAIVSEVRRSVPESVPVSVKMRLGWDSPGALTRNAAEAIEGGASSLAVHGRTKAQGYAPPALWKPIGEIRRISPVPVIANGDLWTFEDFLRCEEETGCRHFMLGRSALADPHLAGRIGRHLGLKDGPPRPFPTAPEWHRMLNRLSELCEKESSHPGYAVSRLKQWIRHVHARHPLERFGEMMRAESLPSLTQAAAAERFTPTFSSRSHS